MLRSRTHSTGPAWQTEALAVTIVVIFAGLLVLPIALVGIPENYDLSQHLRFARSYFDAFSNGSIYPAWAANDNLGYGSVGIRFYPPLSYVPIGLVQFFTASYYDSLWISVLFWMIVGSIGMYVLAREMMPVWWALFAATLYAIVPYHLVQVYQAFLLAEFTASAILPFCFLFALRTVRSASVANVVLLAISVALLILSHIPSTIIVSLGLGIFIAALLERSKMAGAIVRTVSAFALSAAATSFYWIRMVSELDWVKHNTREFYGEGYYNYSTYFFPMFVNGGEAYVPRFLWLWDIIILITIFLIVPAIAVLVMRWCRSESGNRQMLAFTLTAVFSFFMMSIASSLLWDNISILQKIQFPWRWLTVASFAASMVFVMAVRDLAVRSRKIKRPLAYSLALILSAVIVFDLTQAVIPSAPVPRAEFNQRLETLDNEPGCECWWPIWAFRTALQHVQPVEISERQAQITEWSATNRSFIVTEGAETQARVATFYYPHWNAKVNGISAEVRPGNDGAIEVGLPTNKAVVEFEFNEPNAVILSRYFSPLVWILMFIVLGIGLRRSARASEISGLR
jgi:hypothetical protein